MEIKKEKTRRIFIQINRLPPSLNVLIRMHWRARGELQKAFDAQVFAAWIKARKIVFTVPVNLVYVLGFTAQHRRDIDNYIGGTKLITDSLKRTFLFRDDSEWVKSIQVRFIKNDIEETVVMIEEALGKCAP